MSSKRNEREFKIPKSFEIFAHRYEVEICDDLMEKLDRYGDFDPTKRRIRLQDVGVFPSSEKDENGNVVHVDVTEDEQIDTFFHEMAHAVFHALGHTKLGQDEKIASMLGSACHQIWKSLKF